MQRQTTFTRIFLLLLFCLCIKAVSGQSEDEASIRQILSDQTKYWNQGKLDEFVKGYWQHDSLMFIGQSGVTYGYQNMLNNYKKNYSDTIKMGKLAFEIIKVQRLSDQFYFVVGKWFLKRTIGDLNGHYTLLFRRIDGRWVIIADHSS